jgi:predicted nucleotidyltransferase
MLSRSQHRLLRMNPDIQRAITNAWGELQALGVEHLDVFGSEARGSATPESDVDVLVYFRGPATLRQLVALRDRLEALLGRKVDLVTPRALERKPRLRERVLREAVRVA